MAIQIKIDFSEKSIKNNKLFFYEKRKNNKLIEYAYVTEDSEYIYYKPEEDVEEHEYPKNEMNDFLITILNKITLEYSGGRVDLKSKTSKPYFNYRIINKNIPLIWFLAINWGIEGTLKKLKINYIKNKKRIQDLSEKPQFNYYIKFKNGVITCFPKNMYELYLLNGFSKFSPKTIDIEDSENEEILRNFIDNRFGQGIFDKLKDMKFRVIDTTTEKILKIYGYPTDLLTLVSDTMPKKILNDPVDNIDELSSQRIRMSESIAHAAYKQIQQAVGKFKKEKNRPDAKLYIAPNMIIQELQGSGMLQYTRTINPLEELLLSAKITKAGVGNPKREQITLDKRDLNESYFGVISPTTTNEYSGIGLNQTLTNKATIKDRFGTIMLKEFTNNSNSFDNLSFSESLMPFFEYDDTTRRVMGNQQFSQFVQINNPDVPLVQTGFEAIIPFIVSDRFAIKAKKDGKVEIKNNYIIMHYNDGTQEIFSLKPVKARTKRGAYLPLEYNVIVNNNQKVKKGEILAVTNSLKFGKLAVGKNLVVAEMSYRGMNFEDGWVITEDLNEKYQSKMYEKLTIIVPSGVNVTKFNIEKNKETKPGEILIEYTLDKEDIELIENLEEKILENESEDSYGNDIGIGKEVYGNIIRYRSIGGKIADYVIKLNTKKIDSQIYKKWNLQKIQISEQIKICDKLINKINKLDCKNNIEHLDALEIGGHKILGNEIDGAIIEVYIEKENPIRYGSKFTLAATGGKGTVQYVIPKDKKPKALDSGLEIDFIATPLSMISRKNPSIMLLLYSGKIVYFLNKKLEELILNNKINEAKNLAIQIFDILDKSKEKFMINAIKAFFENKPEYIKSYVRKHNPLQDPAFPLLVPPYKNQITISELEKAGKILGIKMNEKVYIPEEDIITDYEVTVGIMPVYLLEHFPKEMSSVRGIINVKRQITTGQGRSGTKEGNGAIRLGLYDIFSLTSRTPENLLKELWLLKTDTKEAKEKLIRTIIRGEKPSLTNIEIKSEDQITKKMIEAFFIGAILDPQF